MEGASLAVTDTGPLIALHAVSLLNVLCARFSEVFVPLTVWNELTALPGSWQVGVDWRKVFPAWYRSVARTAEPEDFAGVVVETVDAFEGHDREEHFAAARKVASAAQRRALDVRAAARAGRGR